MFNCSKYVSFFGNTHIGFVIVDSGPLTAVPGLQYMQLKL